MAETTTKPGRLRDLPDAPRDATMRYIAKKQLWDAIAIQCGISPRAVRLWKRVPSRRVLDVERATGRPRRMIRKDLYPN